MVGIEQKKRRKEQGVCKVKESEDERKKKKE